MLDVRNERLRADEIEKEKKRPKLETPLKSKLKVGFTKAWMRATEIKAKKLDA